jgi:hypothetical protein
VLVKIHRLASSLPGSAGWVLLELIETPENGVGQLTDVLDAGERTIERAVKHLESLGLCVFVGRSVTLAQDWTERVQILSQTMRKAGDKPDAKTAPKLTQTVNKVGDKPDASLVTKLTNLEPHTENPPPAFNPSEIVGLNATSTNRSSTEGQKGLETSTSTPGHAVESELKGARVSPAPPAPPEQAATPDQPSPPDKPTSGPGSRSPRPRAQPSWKALLQREDFTIPEWLNLEAWCTWLEYLQDRRLDASVGVLRTHLNKLKKLLDAGFDQADVIETAMSRQWKTVGEVTWDEFQRPTQPVSNGASTKRTGSQRPQNFKPGADEIYANLVANSRFLNGGSQNHPSLEAATSSDPPTVTVPAVTVAAIAAPAPQTPQPLQPQPGGER